MFTNIQEMHFSRGKLFPELFVPTKMEPAFPDVVCEKVSVGVEEPNVINCGLTKFGLSKQ